jgi:hypothetical protein
MSSPVKFDWTEIALARYWQLAAVSRFRKSNGEGFSTLRPVSIDAPYYPSDNSLRISQARKAAMRSAAGTKLGLPCSVVSLTKVIIACEQPVYAQVVFAFH